MIEFSDRKVGVEIEVESTFVPLTIVEQHLSRLALARAWILDAEEGSLRAGNFGWEVKSIHPGRPIGDLLSDLTQLYPILYGSTGNWRAAVHVHVDTRCVNLQQAFALAYVLDPDIFSMYSPERVESNFCVPLDYNMYDVRQQLRLFASGGCAVWRGYNKYRSVNVCALERFNTLEFRHMRTPKTSDSVREVKDAIDHIYRYAHTCAMILHRTQEGRYGSIAEMFENVPASSFNLNINEFDPERVYNVLQVCDAAPRVAGVGPELTALGMVSPARGREVLSDPDETYLNRIAAFGDSVEHAASEAPDLFVQLAGGR